MAHELTTRASGFTEMAFVGETPWHGLGQQLTQGASLDTWAQAAGMDWRVKRSKVRYFADQAGTDQREWPENHVLLRGDTGAPLGLVSEGYKVVQPKTVLEFFRDLTENAGYQLHTAGTLFGGRKFWALAKVASACVVGADKVDAFLLLSTSCDGTSATEAKEVATRVVCNNTLTIARGERNGSIKVGHRSTFNADRVKAQMQNSADNFAGFIEQTQRLASIRVTNAMAEEFVRKLLRPNETELNREIETLRAPKGEAEILALFRGNAMGGTLFGTAGTAWGLVNAVSEFYDWRKSGKTPSHQLDSALFGAGDAMKSRAFELAFTI